MKNLLFLLLLVYSSFLYSQPDCPNLDEIVLCANTSTDVDIFNFGSDLISVTPIANNDDIVSFVDVYTINFYTQPYSSTNIVKYRVAADLNKDCSIHYSVLGLNSTLSGSDSPINYEITSCPGNIKLDDLTFNCTSCDYSWELDQSPQVVNFANSVVAGVNTFITFKNITTQIFTPGPHQLCLTVSHPDAIGCFDEYCFDIVIEELTDVPTFDVIGYDDCICPNQDIYFQNTSTYDPAVGSYIWEVIDNASGLIVYSAETIDFLYLFDNPGLYTVQLTYSQMVAQTECVSPTTTFQVVVKDTDFIEISCPSVVCSGGPQISYIALDDGSCSNFVWSFTGPVQSSNQNVDGTIQIIWDEVTEYTVGSVVLESADCDTDYCFPNIIDVPLFPTATEIMGPDQVCVDQILTYNVANIPGSFYDWSIEVEDVNGNITTHSANSNSSSLDVFFNALPNGIVTITVDISNPYAGCDVTDKIEVLYPNITGDDDICLGDIINIDYSLPNSPTVNYTITDFFGTVLTTGTSLPVNFVPSNPGTYMVDFETGGIGCFEQVEITVHEVLTPNINGEFAICPGETYTYSIPCGQDESASWNIIGGNIVTDFGCVIEVVWDINQPQYQIDVNQMLALDNGSICSGQLESVVIEVAMPEIVISGPETICYDALSSYTINDIGAEEYIWTINPENIGSVVNGQGSIGTDIQWLYNPNITSADITVEGNICGNPITSTMTVQFGDLSLDISPTSTICENETQLVSITGVGQSLNSWSSIEWLVNGNPYVAGEDMDEVSFVFNSIGSNTIQAIITNPNGCFQTVNLSTQIDVVESPDPIFSYSIACPLVANNYLISVTNINGAATYEWYENNVIIPGETNSSITITQADLSSPSYVLRVKVTLANGCQSDEVFDFGNFCSDNSGDECCTWDLSIPFLTFDGCKSIEFIGNIQNYSNQNANWVIIYDLNGPNELLLDITAIEDGGDLTQEEILLTSGPGLYTIGLEVQCGVDPNDGSPCYAGTSNTILLPFEEEFTHFFICDPVTNTYTLRLSDNSIYAEDSPSFTNLIDYQWTAVGQANQSGMGLQEVDFTGLTPGSSIDVSLNLVGYNYGANECPPLVKTIDVPKLPDADFSIINDYSCLGQILTFTSTQDPSELLLTEWNFGDGSFSRINPVGKVYSDDMHPNHPDYDVILTVTDIYGCSSSNMEQLSITDNVIDGIITSDMMGSCNSMAELTFNVDAGNTFPIVDYNWSHPNAGNGKSAMITQSGIYSVTVTDSQGCTEVFTSQEIILQDAFSSDLSVTQNNCGNKVINFSVNIGFEYLVQVTKGSLTYFTTNNNFIISGTYDVTVYAFDSTPVDENTDLSTACAYDQISFEVIPKPNIPELDLGSFDCTTESILIEIINIGSYDLADHTIIWDGPGIVNTTDVFSVNAFSNGLYSATVIDRETGCFEKRFFNLTKAAPDLSGMITGCYETCEVGGLLVDGILTAPVNVNVGSWSWDLDGTPIANYSGISSFPINLVLGDVPFITGQEHTITFTYNIDGCEFESEPFCLTVEDCTQDDCLVYADGQACGNDPIDCAVSENDGGPIYFINMDYLIPSGDDFSPPAHGVKLSYCDVEPFLVSNGTLFVSEIQQIGSDQLSVIGSFSIANTSNWSGSSPVAVQVNYCGDDGNIYCVQYEINPVYCPTDPLECNVWYVGAASAGPKDRDNYLAQYCVNLYNVNSNGCQSTDWTIEGEFEDSNGNTISAYNESISITGQGTVVTHCFDVNIPVTMDFNQVPYINFNITSNCPGIGCFHQFWHLGTENYSGNPLRLVGVPFDEKENTFTLNLPKGDYPDIIEGSLYFDGKVYDVSGGNAEWNVIINKPDLAIQNSDLTGVLEYMNSENESIVKVVKIELKNNSNFRTNNYKIFPNPFSGELNVAAEFTENTKLEVLDILGRRINFIQRTIDSNQAGIAIEAKAGLYFINIYENNILIASEKVIKL